MAENRCQHTWVPTDWIPVCTKCGNSPTASPSQIETWRDCKRKWAYSRIRERTSSPAADYGTRCHTIAENWGRFGTPPDSGTPEGRTVLTALHLLPMPGTAAIEPPAKPVLLGIPFDMRLDWVDQYLRSISVRIGDLKTTGDIAQNAKTSEKLRTTDPQGVTYAHWAAETFDVPTVHGRWAYGQRDCKAAARPVDFTISRQEAADRFAAMHAAEILPMVRARVLAPESLPRSLEACSKYGGCPYRDECLTGLTSLERATSALHQLRRKDTPMTPDLLANLLANTPKTDGPIQTSPSPAVAQASVPVATLAPDIEAALALLPPELAATARASMDAAQPVPDPEPATVVPEAPVESKPRRGRPPKDKSKEAPTQPIEVVEALPKDTIETLETLTGILAEDRWVARDIVVACISAGKSIDETKSFLALLGAS